MIDREKVIKGLRQHCDGSMVNRCRECPYYEMEPSKCRDALLKDVTDMLRGTYLWTAESNIMETLDDVCKSCQEFTCDDCKIWDEKHRRNDDG